ncbi:MAG: hypothetical protein ACE5FL_00305 [Myxococcota bacterium]
MQRPIGRSRALSAILVSAIAAATAGCITRSVRQTFFEDSTTRILLRSEEKGGESIDRGYAHPIHIAPVRLAHILSRLEVRTGDEKHAQRSPAIPTQALYSIADQLAEALEAVDSSQEIAVLYIEREKRWGVFDRRFLTSFVLYARDDSLYIHLSRIRWEIEKKGKTERLPEPRVGDYVMKFRVIPSQAMTRIDGQSVVVDWRDPIFKRPTRVRIDRSGKVYRKTILMESPLEETEQLETDPDFERLPENLSSKALRDLADLEDERHRGDISEAEYYTRRRAIIHGRAQ